MQQNEVVLQPSAPPLFSILVGEYMTLILVKNIAPISNGDTTSNDEAQEMIPSAILILENSAVTSAITPALLRGCSSISPNMGIFQIEMVAAHTQLLYSEKEMIV